MSMNPSVKNFIQYVSGIDQYIQQIHISDQNLREWTHLIAAAERVFVTGTGTSLPTAKYLADSLQQTYPMKPVSFLLTAKMIRQNQQLQPSDLVIIISHGFNRADACIIYEGAKKHCRTILITGSESPTVDKDTLVINVPPAVEKTFCRPVSPITTLLAIHRLLGNKLPRSYASNLDIEELVSWLDPHTQTVLLYAADVSYAAELWAIVLREGAGINLLIKDIESYSHGYYGVDTAALDERQFLILSSSSELDKKDVARADGLYSIAGFNKRFVAASGDKFTANLSLFLAAPKFVKGIITKTNRDLDHPVGMEENRKYHEYDRYRDYYPS